MSSTFHTTVVLLHGFGEDHSIFKHQIRVLAKSYNLFVPDLPGSGVLNNFQWEKDEPTMEGLAIWVYEQLQQKQISQCIMLGHSMGGYITLAFAELYPEVLMGFGLLHSSAFADAPEKIKNRLKAVRFMQKKGAFPFLKAAIPGLFIPTFAKKHPDEVAQLVEKARSYKTDWLVAYYKAIIARPDRTHVLKKATVPILIVAGMHDGVISLDYLLKQAQIPAICHFHLLKGAAHMGMVEDKSVFNQILLHFLFAVQTTSLSFSHQM